MSDWSDAGLPAPQESGYGYAIDAGLLRTPFDAPQPRQRRKHRQHLRTFDLTFVLAAAQLDTALAFIIAHGYDWFTIELMSGAGAVNHTVRLVDKPSIRSTQPGDFLLACKAEEQPTPVPSLSPTNFATLPPPGHWASDGCTGYTYIEPPPPPPPTPGLFILPAGYTLEPNPSRIVAGTLIATVGTWRLFRDTSFSTGVYRDGICTQYQGTDYTACMWYEADASSHPSAVYGKIGDGEFAQVADWPYETGFCWYMKGVLVGVVRTFHPKTVDNVTFVTRNNGQWVESSIPFYETARDQEFGIFDPLAHDSHELSLDGSVGYWRYNDHLMYSHPFSEWRSGDPFWAWPGAKTSFETLTHDSQGCFWDDWSTVAMSTTYVNLIPDNTNYEWIRNEEDREYPSNNCGKWLWLRSSEKTADHDSITGTVLRYSPRYSNTPGGVWYDYYRNYWVNSATVTTDIPGCEFLTSFSDFSETKEEKGRPYCGSDNWLMTTYGRMNITDHWVRSAAIGLITTAELIWSATAQEGSTLYEGASHTPVPMYWEPGSHMTFTTEIGGSTIPEPFVYVASTVANDKACLILGLTNDGFSEPYIDEEWLGDRYGYPNPPTYASPHSLYGYDGESVTDLSSLLSYMHWELGPFVYNTTSRWYARDQTEVAVYLPFPTTRATS